MNEMTIVRDVRGVLELLRTHAIRVQRVKDETKTKLEQRSNWLSAIGAALVAIGFFVDYYARQAVGPAQSSTLSQASFLTLCIGLLLVAAGLALSAIDLKRTTSRPFNEHVNRISDLLPIDADLIDSLLTFDTRILEFARQRLAAESSKVRARLELIGGGTRMTASFFGIVTLGYLLIQRYVGLNVATFSLEDFLALLGIAALVGVSISAWHVSDGAGRGDYYRDLIGLAIHVKTANESERPVQERGAWRRARMTTR